ncbi:MAG: hypothetical protein WCV50_06075 [Patescibacteria group bacterium]|jgi:hypothetical protein
MQKIHFKVFGYGLQLFIITLLLLFIMSAITSSEQPVDLWWAGTIVAILLAGCSWLFTLRLHPAKKKQAFTFGAIWAVMLVVILLLITIPNGTTDIVFGQWSTYLIFIGVAVGPLFAKIKPSLP